MLYRPRRYIAEHEQRLEAIAQEKAALRARHEQLAAAATDLGRGVRMSVASRKLGELRQHLAAASAEETEAAEVVLHQLTEVGVGVGGMYECGWPSWSSLSSDTWVQGRSGLGCRVRKRQEIRHLP